MSSESIPAAIRQLADQLRAARAASPPSPLRRMLREASQRVLDDAPRPTRTRKRKPTLAGVARQAARVGIEVARYEVRPDGSIAVVTGKPAASDIDSNNNTAIPDRSEWN